MFSTQSRLQVFAASNAPLHDRVTFNAILMQFGVQTRPATYPIAHGRFVAKQCLDWNAWKANNTTYYSKTLLFPIMAALRDLVPVLPDQAPMRGVGRAGFVLHTKMLSPILHISRQVERWALDQAYLKFFARDACRCMGLLQSWTQTGKRLCNAGSSTRTAPGSAAHAPERSHLWACSSWELAADHVSGSPSWRAAKKERTVWCVARVAGDLSRCGKPRQGRHSVLVYTTQANSAFRAIWLVPQSRDFKYYSPPGGFRVKKMSRETHFIRKWSNFMGIAIKFVLYILKQLFASVSVTSGGYLPRRSGSVNIHRYSPPLLRIIANCWQMGEWGLVTKLTVWGRGSLVLSLPSLPPHKMAPVNCSPPTETPSYADSGVRLTILFTIA